MNPPNYFPSGREAEIPHFVYGQAMRHDKKSTAWLLDSEVLWRKQCTVCGPKRLFYAQREES